MNFEEIEKIIKNINNYSDNQILKMYEDIYNNLIENYYFIEAEEFIIIVIKKIKDTTIKTKLIKKYLTDPLNINNLIKSTNNLEFEEKKKIFKEIYSKYKFEKITELLDIPNDINLGIELEYTDLSYNLLEKLFNNDSIKDLMRVLEIDEEICEEITTNTIFKETSEYNKWNFTVEMDDERQPELSSPILKNEIKDLNTLKAFHYILYALNAKISGYNALQINVDANYFDGNIDGLKYLLSIWAECEEIFYKIANKENETIRFYASDMAKPIKQNIQKTFNEKYSFKIETEREFYKFIYNIQVRENLQTLLNTNILEKNDKFKNLTENEKAEIFTNLFTEKKEIISKIKCKSINFIHMDWYKINKGRIEFRIFNNTMDFETILLNITLIGKLIHVSKELANKNNQLLEKYQKLLETNKTEEEKLDTLLNLLFNDNIKEKFKKRWESIKDKTEYNIFYTGEKTFEPYNNYKKSKTI